MSDFTPSSTFTVSDEQAFQWICEHTRAVLGFPTIAVELDDSQIKVAADDALRIMNKWTFEGEMKLYREKSDSVVIQLDESARGVVAVHFFMSESARFGGETEEEQAILGQASGYSRTNIFELIYRMVYPKFPVGDWYMFKSFFEMFHQTRGTEADWRYDSFSKKLYCDCHSGPYDIYVVISKDLTYSSLYLGRKTYLQDYLDLVVARAKQILSRVIGKFAGSIPAPGGNITTDANEIRQEGITREKEIVDVMKKRAKFSMIGRVG